MKRQINLIPEEMSVPAKVVTLAKTLNKISTVGTILLILTIIGLIAGMVYFNVERGKTTTNIASLKQQIVDLERSEQKLILAKDKLSKIAYIKNSDSIDTELSNFIEFENSVSGASSAISFTEINIDPTKTEVSFAASDSGSLSSTLEKISTLAKYKKIVMTSLGFNATSGYVVSLVFND